MKSFLNFFSEARTSQASDQAARRGWTGDGHGNWYDKAGDLITDYYKIRDNKEKDIKESKSILEYLNRNSKKEEKNNRAKIFEKFCQRIDGVRVKIDDGSKRIKYSLRSFIVKKVRITV